jgi:1,2-dihydroxy-3-keto-5-methylthiopentene dioxygenase
MGGAKVVSQIQIYADTKPGQVLNQSDKPRKITEYLNEVGVRFEQWQAANQVSATDSAEVVMAAYQADIDRLIDQEGYVTVDVVGMTPSHPDKAAMRQKFLAEHKHSEDEVRFFVDGQGLFTLHIADKVYEVLCEKGDLISVPANTPHWFDMGPNPQFVAIRLFNNPDGWVAHYTGEDIAQQFSRLEN